MDILLLYIILGGLCSIISFILLEEVYKPAKLKLEQYKRIEIWLSQRWQKRLKFTMIISLLVGLIISIIRMALVFYAVKQLILSVMEKI